jgi:hypothetical protein
MTEPPGPARLPDGGDPAIFAPAVDWWNTTVAARGRLPARADLRPEDLGGRTLPHVLLVDVGDAGARMRFRLMGSAHVAFNQVDLSGRDFDTIYPEGGTLDYVRGLYRNMCATRRPLWSVNEVRHFRTGLPIVIRRLMLPMATDGSVVDLCLGVQTIHRPPDRGVDAVNPWHVARSIIEHERRLL